ncbi:hypothetical protein Val02_05890 [Virgisporangium aliadipatigenens]|uniref:Uncharacterized protein n=1 Tax=Virgisporangium aliadipatigenens TaxID=741659 RepID=A0A8J3YGR7_9ACTN|nr:hypothetical protein Val02_05890 [Virgisporangium aliadipatigenens]
MDVTLSPPPIRIELTGPEAKSELGSLIEWLQAHPGVGDRAVLTEVGSGRQGTGLMGDPAFVIELAVTATFETAKLMLAIATWRRACRSESSTVVRRAEREIPAPDGNAGPDDIDRAARRLDGGD